MNWKNPDWKYHDAATTAKPGYLKRRMAHYRKQLEEQEKTVQQKVKPIRRANG